MEFPHLQDLYSEYRDQSFSVVAVESRGDRTGARSLIEDNGYSFTVLFDTDGVHRKSYNVYGFPSTFILNREGDIVYQHVGFYPGMEIILEEEIRQLLGLSARPDPSS